MYLSMNYRECLSAERARDMELAPLIRESSFVYIKKTELALSSLLSKFAQRLCVKLIRVSLEI